SFFNDTATSHFYTLSLHDALPILPLNYRLTADDFVYLISHSGSRIVCADGDYLGTIDGIRSRLPHVERFVALTGEGATEYHRSRSEEHTSELQSLAYLVCRLLLEK